MAGPCAASVFDDAGWQPMRAFCGSLAGHHCVASPLPGANPNYWLQGLVFIGPALHFWYGTLGRVVTAKGTAGEFAATDLIRRFAAMVE
jgi:hypothetical protein